jgi:hypothetical protein
LDVVSVLRLGIAALVLGLVFSETARREFSPWQKNFRILHRHDQPRGKAAQAGLDESPAVCEIAALS